MYFNVFLTTFKSHYGHRHPMNHKSDYGTHATGILKPQANCQYIINHNLVHKDSSGENKNCVITMD